MADFLQSNPGTNIAYISETNLISDNKKFESKLKSYVCILDGTQLD